MIKVFVADSHSLIRLGLSSHLEKSKGMTLIGETHSGLRLIERLTNETIDVLVTDLELYDLDGLEATKKVKSLNKGIGIVIYTDQSDEFTVLRALRAGADAYLLKDCSAECLNLAINAVSCAESYLDPRVSSLLVRYLRRSSQEEKMEMLNSAKTLAMPISARELDVLRLVEKGLANREIAEILCLSTDTVKFHIRHILDKLKVKSRTEAATKFLALRSDLLS